VSVVIAMLVHDALDRAAQVARHWAEHGCPVVIHVDRCVSDDRLAAFQEQLADLDTIRYSPRFRCHWGTWALVAASQAAAEMALRDFPHAGHVFLASGSCLPLRPVEEFTRYLDRHEGTDFIESVTIDEVPWTVGGLDTERFTLSFPFAWKSQRFLFDRFVEVQRALGYRRRMPAGLAPHLGSQWWCLSRRTLLAILRDPRRAEIERFFRRVWIPDESYFQTVARMHSGRIESRSLTLAKFDFQGRPHIFFDDHLQLLRRSDCFVARKIWAGADGLYRAFLTEPVPAVNTAEPNPAQIDRIFTRAVQRRTRGRPGLCMPGRFLDLRRVVERTAAPYSVFSGVDSVFPDVAAWIETLTEMRVHGHLFAPERAMFADDQRVYSGALSDTAALRDYDPAAFLRNLVWNTRGERQAFQFGPADRQEIAPFLAEDPNAHITLVTGAWALDLFRTTPDARAARTEAARLQRREAAFAALLRRMDTRARVRILTLAEMLEQPLEVLQHAIEDIGAPQGQHLAEAPRMTDLGGFDTFLQDLKNLGMNPYLVGDFHSVIETGATARAGGRPYLVQ
jgi:hypothetical protein